MRKLKIIKKLSLKTISVLWFVLLGGVLAVQGQEIPTAPALTPDEVRFAAVGDTGNGNEGQNAIARQMLSVQEKSRFDLILFLGDNIYRNGEPKDFGKKFTIPYQKFIENGTELRAAIGNHDARSKDGVLLQQMMFQMGAKPFYSFTRGNRLAEFFALDTNAFLTAKLTPEGEAQLRWFDRRLAASKAVWKIVFLHHSLYSSAKKHGWNSADREEMENVRRAIEPFLEKHRVKLVLSGHDHIYERTKPQKGVHHFVSGVGSEIRPGDLQTESPFYGFGNDQELSFMLFSVTPKAVRFWAINAQGTVFDRGQIE